MCLHSSQSLFITIYNASIFCLHFYISKSVSEPSSHVGLRLDHLIAVFLIGYSINNRSNQFKITGAFCNNSYRFHYRFGTPPSLPSVHNLDSEYPESMSSLVICILCKVV